jgi:hypothetical protein
MRHDRTRRVYKIKVIVRQQYDAWLEFWEENTPAAQTSEVQVSLSMPTYVK